MSACPGMLGTGAIVGGTTVEVGARFALAMGRSVGLGVVLLGASEVGVLGELPSLASTVAEVPAGDGDAAKVD